MGDSVIKKIPSVYKGINFRISKGKKKKDGLFLVKKTLQLSFQQDPIIIDRVMR